MASKNNPRNRDRQKLILFCPECDAEMTLIKRVPGGMVNKCTKNADHVYPARKGGYTEYRHEWVNK